MSVTLNREEIRLFDDKEYPCYYLYQYLPLPTENAAFISDGGVFLEDPLTLPKFQVGYKITNEFPALRTWEVVRTEIYQGSDQTVCNGMIVCWCKEV